MRGNKIDLWGQGQEMKAWDACGEAGQVGRARGRSQARQTFVSLPLGFAEEISRFRCQRLLWFRAHRQESAPGPPSCVDVCSGRMEGIDDVLFFETGCEKVLNSWSTNLPGRALATRNNVV